MANHKSAIKKTNHDAKARLCNRANRSALKTSIKKFLSIVTTGDREGANTILSKTISTIDKACRKGILHKNASNRYKSRLMNKLNTITQ